MLDRRDIKTDDITNDLVFENGDLKIFSSDQRHIQDTINGFPGWWKEYPLTCVGLAMYLGSPATDQVLISKIKTELALDGYQTNQTSIVRGNNDEITIYPNVY
jgi:hypothetical protein